MAKKPAQIQPLKIKGKLPDSLMAANAELNAWWNLQWDELATHPQFAYHMPTSAQAIPTGEDWQTSYYGQVGKALGFTENEVNVLVKANDKGLSFATIATLIEEHPPVLSAAMTPRRQLEEDAFLANVNAAIKHHAGPAKYHGLGGILESAPSKKPFTYGSWGKSPNTAWYVNYDKILNDSVFAGLDFTGWSKNPFALTMSPKHGLVLPKSGEYAKLLGIWLPS